MYHWIVWKSPITISYKMKLILNSPIYQFCILASFLLFSTASYAFSSHIDFVHINNQNGLSSEEIRCVFQDREGYMWFATYDGLNRFDGYVTKVFKMRAHLTGLSVSSFESICEDSQGRLWLGSTSKGVLIFDKKDERFYTFDEFSKDMHLGELSVRTIKYDNKDCIWVGTEDGLYHYDLKKDDLTHYKLAGISGRAEKCIVEDIMQDKEGNIWIATWSEGLLRYQQESDLFKHYEGFDRIVKGERSNRIRSLFQDKMGYVWVGTWENGLYKTSYANDTLIIKEVFISDEYDPKTLSGNIIYDINQDDNGNLWVGTPYGISIIESLSESIQQIHQIKHRDENDGLSNDEVWTITKDAAGIMWLGTLEGGINMASSDGQIIESYKIPRINKRIQSQTVNAFFQDAQGRLLLGIKSLGFGYYDLEKEIYTPHTSIPLFKKLVPYEINTVNCFLKKDMDLWLGTRYHGLILVNTSGEVISLDSIMQPSYDVQSMLLTRDQTVWVGAADGLFKVRKENFQSIKETNVQRITEFDGMRITSMCEDKDGVVWIGTSENGICKVQNGNNHFYSYNRKSITDKVMTIYCDSKNQVWVGSNDAGLVKYNRNKDAFEACKEVQGLSSSTVLGIIEDKQSELWLTTNNGLIHMAQKDSVLRLENYTVLDGLQGNSFVPNSIYKADKKLYIGGYYGFNCFDPYTITSNGYTPPTVITEIKVNDVAYFPKDSKEKVFTHKENSFLFSFSSLSYYKSDKNIFAYKLQGVDKEWIITDALERTVRYPKLASGDYTFRIKSANSSEVWNETPVTFTFRVLSAPYETWWAISLYVIAIAMLILGIFHYLLNKEKIIRKLEVEQLKHERQEKINEYKLRFFTNISHEILTPLSIIMGAVGLLKKKSRKGIDEINIMERNLDGLRRLLGQLLDFRKMESGNLELKVRENNIIKHVYGIIENLQFLAKDKNIKLSFESDNDMLICYFDEDKINKIVQNLISNAIKYTPDGGQVSVGIKSDSQSLIIKISDTGVGISSEELDGVFDRFYRAESGREESGTGIGLALVKKLVSMHYGTITVKSKPETGAIFIVTLPLNRNRYSEDDFAVDNYDAIKDIEEMELDTIPSVKNISIMIVDDNADFRKILANHLSEYAKVIESSNGESALRRAVNYAPDIIVSDVMMPNMNGYELCVQLKSNVETQHIPVILLTAKSTDIERTRGYESGADSYITKPVSLPVLQSRIHSLLMRKTSKITHLETNDLVFIPNSPIDGKTFIEKLEQLTKDNLTDVNFKVSDMHSPFGMSSSSFFRKVKKLTKLSPNEYLKKARVNRAALLLRKGELTIMEVAINSGFTDHSYFGVCFKKEFMVTPSQYVKKYA